MGLIRKSLALGTGGFVSGSSKKQRVARATLRNTAGLVAGQERQFRYDTDPVFRAQVDHEIAARNAAAADQQRRSLERREHRAELLRSGGGRAKVIGVGVIQYGLVVPVVALMLAVLIPMVALAARGPQGEGASTAAGLLDRCRPVFRRWV